MNEYYQTITKLLDKVTPANIANLKRFCNECMGTIFVAGNGGSLANSLHFAEDFSKVKRKRAVALGCDPSFLTMTANDYNFESIFSHDLKRQSASPLDRLLVITTSGRSRNIVRCIQAAKEMSIPVLAIIGKHTSEMDSLGVDYLSIPSTKAQEVEDVSMIALHDVVYN
jgi:D-sedoheptulose 7-phosphate isomerase